MQTYLLRDDEARAIENLRLLRPKQRREYLAILAYVADKERPAFRVRPVSRKRTPH